MEDASREGPGSVGAGFFADMRYLNRALHRGGHLDEVELALAKSSE